LNQYLELIEDIKMKRNGAGRPNVGLSAREFVS
jgi:hypothetical protein